MQKKLREKYGSTMPGVTLVLIIFCMLIVLFISFIPLYSHKQNQDTAATEIARYIEIKGAVNSDVYNYVNEIKDTLNIDFDFFVDANYIGASKNIQLEDKFTVTLTYQAKYGIGGIMTIPIPLRSEAHGVSEKYRK